MGKTQQDQRKLYGKHFKREIPALSWGKEPNTSQSDWRRNPLTAIWYLVSEQMRREAVPSTQARGGQITHERMLIGLKQRHMTTVNRLLKAKRKTEERFAPGKIGVQRSTTGWNNALAERRNLSDKSTEHFESEWFWKLCGGKKEISTIGAASQRCRQEKLKTL